VKKEENPLSISPFTRGRSEAEGAISPPMAEDVRRTVGVKIKIQELKGGRG